MDTKRCSKCGETKSTDEFSKNRTRKDGLQSQCKACKSECDNRYQQASKEKIAARRKAHRQANKEKLAAKDKAYRQANKEEIAAKKKAYSEANQEKIAAKNKAYREANKEKIAARDKAWKKSNPEKVSAYKQRRRAREANAPGDATAEQVKARFDYYGNKCVYCSTGENLHVDHRIPLSRGGSNWPANLAPACASCNHRKYRKTETEYKAQLATESNDGTAKPDLHTGSEIHHR